MKRTCQPVNGICTQCNESIPERFVRECRLGGGTVAINRRPPPLAKPPQVVSVHREPSRVLLGDRIESALIAVGITKEKWGEFVNEHGLPPGCSSCDKRQQQINSADEWARKATAKLGQVAIDAISAFWRPLRPKARPPE